MIESFSNSARLAAIAIYNRFTAGYRQRRLRALASLGEAPLSVLFYHRVADHYPNPWTISTSEFTRHVEYCRERFDLITLDELQRRVRERDSFRPSVTFTFDDGYAENCRHALPLLIRYQIPCVYFVAVDHIREAKPFSHDIERGVPLPVNTVDELRAAADGGIEIGLHTRSHFDFSTPFDAGTLRYEIVEAKRELETMIGRPVRYFAFPYGMPKHLACDVIQAVYDCGMKGFCSAYGAYNRVGQDEFHIRRFHGDPTFVTFENWLTFDQRKIDREPAVPYQLRTPSTTAAFEPQHA